MAERHRVAKLAPGGVQSLLGDGSVQFFNSSIDGDVWRALGTISGGDWVNSVGADGS